MAEDTRGITEAFVSPDKVVPFEAGRRAIKFADLPEDVQQLLFYMDPDDVRLFRKALRFIAFMESFGRLVKWAALAFSATTAGVVMFGEQLGKIAEWRIWELFVRLPK